MKKSHHPARKDTALLKSIRSVERGDLSAILRTPSAAIHKDIAKALKAVASTNTRMNRGLERVFAAIKQGNFSKKMPLRFGGRPLKGEWLNTARSVNSMAASLQKMDQATKTAQADLRRSEQQFRLIAENVDDLIALVDRKGRRLYSSPSYRMLGNTKSLHGTDSFNEIHPEDRKKIRRVFEQTVKTGVGQRAEFRFLLKDGSVRYIESQGNVIRDAAGRVERLVVVSRDVTERKKSEAKERLLQEELEQSDRLKSLGQTLAGVAHELNNPLTGIIGFCELLLHDRAVQNQPRLRQDIDEIFQQSQRCRRIIRDISTFARRHKPSKNFIDINRLVRESLRLEAYQFRTQNIKIQTHLAHHLPHTMADTHQLQQVFLNLFINAFHAMKSHSLSGTLTIHTRLHNGYIRLEIQDSGPGIPQEDIKKIFEPFFTTKEVGKGTGLGLSICYGIIHEHGGRIWAESPPRQGAKFIVELPILKAPPTASHQAGDTSKPLPSGMNVLIIDDEEVLHSVIKRMCERIGVQVTSARDGKAAKKKLEHHRFDAVLCDVNMPGMDGRQLYEWVRKNRPEMLSRWVFITGSITTETHDFLKQTRLPSIKKPFQLRMLKKILEIITRP